MNQKPETNPNGNPSHRPARTTILQARPAHELPVGAIRVRGPTPQGEGARMARSGPPPPHTASDDADRRRAADHRSPRIAGAFSCPLRGPKVVRPTRASVGSSFEVLLAGRKASIHAGSRV